MMAASEVYQGEKNTTIFQDISTYESRKEKNLNKRKQFFTFHIFFCERISMYCKNSLKSLKARHYMTS